MDRQVTLLTVIQTMLYPLLAWNGFWLVDVFWA